MQKTFPLFILPLLLVNCLAGNPSGKEKTVNQSTVTNSVKTTPATKDTLVLDELDDSMLIVSLFRDIEYRNPIGFVYKENDSDEGDTAFIEVIHRDTIIGSEDTLYYFCVQGPEFYQHGHTLHDQDGALLLKRGKKWIVTDTLEHGFVFDVVGETEITAVGNYFVMTDRNEGAYNGGNYEAGEAFTVIYKGRAVDGLSYWSATDNGGSGMCSPDESDSSWQCNCERGTGFGHFELDVKTRVLLLYSFETTTYYSGHLCEDSTVTTEVQAIACYKNYSKTIIKYSQPGPAKKQTWKKELSDFLAEAKKALGEN